VVDLSVLVNGYIIISTNFRTWTGMYPSCNESCMLYLCSSYIKILFAL